MRKAAVLVGGLLLFAVGGCAPAPSTAAPPVKEPPAAGGEDLKWARSVAEDFLDAVKNSQRKGAYGLLSPDFRDRLTDREKQHGEFYPWVNGVASEGEDVTSWHITAEEAAPGGGEARFKGEVVSRAVADSTLTTIRPFTLIVTKGKDSGLWRVSLISVGFEKSAEPRK